jgi:alkaline phosphatase
MIKILKAAALLATTALAACASTPPTSGSADRSPATTAPAPMFGAAPAADLDVAAEILTPALPAATNVDWFAQGAAAVRATLEIPTRPSGARNVILFIGDGMSLDTVSAARIFSGQRQGRAGESHRLRFEQLPYTALMKTYTTDMQVPDSAGTATAMLTGVKTKTGFIGVSDSAVLGRCEGTHSARLTTFLEQMEQRGKATGVVTTTRITHATPAATYAHVPHRNWESDTTIPASQAAGCPDIARQLAGFDIGDGIEVMFGGGRRQFLPATETDPEYADKTGGRADGRNLIAEWQARYGSDARYVWNATQLASLDPSTTQRVLGLFEPSHMMFDADRLANDADEPSLADLTGFAIDRLSRDPDGFFLLVEGGRIDHAHHRGNAARALADTVAFDDAVASALARVDLDETLVIVTSDHGHVLSFGGYPRRGNPILGKVVVHGMGAPDGPRLARDNNGLPFTTLGYANGPGHRPTRPDLTDVDTTNLNYKQEAAVPLNSETHSGTDVIVFADGPGADLFRGVQEQNYVYHVMRHAVDAR